MVNHMEYQFKRQPHAKQLEAFNLSKNMRSYALLMRMGTGKSKVVIDTTCYNYNLGRINALVILAPKGIHTKWVKEDLPNDIPDYIDYTAMVWRSGDKKAIAACETLFNPGTHLRILAMNIEALQFDNSPAEKFLARFLNATDAVLAVDESDTIKNPDAKRTKRVLKYGDKASFKRILSGTPVNNSPFDLYSQFTFINPEIFGQSFYAFKHTYAEILPDTHPTIRAIKARGVRFTPAIVATTKEGKPIWKNLDKLKELIAPYSFTCTLEECHDLPPKIYETIYYDLETKQRKIYDQLAEKAKAELEDDTVTVTHKLTLLMRLQQALSGFLPGDTEELITLFPKIEDNPRIDALKTILETIGENEQVIIWCRFREEIRQIASLLGDECVTYYGETKDRETNMELFVSGKRRILVANTATGGVGLNLVNAHYMIYYSNDFSYRNRDQSESRQYRIGQTKNVVIYDIVAENTIDEKITTALRDKKDLAIEMMRL